MMKFNKIAVTGLCIVSMFAFAGCDKDKPADSNTGTKVQQPAKPASKKEEVTVKLYYPDRQGQWLYEVTAKVDKNNKYKAAVQALIDGPKEKKLMGIFPPGTKIRSLVVKDGRATVDFSRELVDNFPGGAMVEEMIIGSTVNTLTAFSEIKSVKITVVGKDTVVLSNMDFVDPYERMPEMIKKK